ncbi:hypothetical protein [Bradyrhizobium sp. LeoA1S1]
MVGNPIDHTKSPLIHFSFAKETGQNIDYVAIEAPIGDFNEVVDKFRREGGLGLNITAPFKLDAFAYCTDLKERARLAGAVNAMKFEVDRVTGENFDGVGLTNDITRNLGRSMKGRRVALLGAGGAQHRFQWSASAPARIRASWLPGHCRASPSRAAATRSGS